MKAIAAKCLALLLASQAIYATTSTIKLGSIDRANKGRVYTVGLTSSAVERVSFSSTSKHPEGKIMISSVDYFDGVEFVRILERDSFTSRNAEELSFPLENITSYPISPRQLNCGGPCLVIRAEAYSSDDLFLNIKLKSFNGDVIGANMIAGLAPRSTSTPSTGGRTGGVHSIKTNGYVLRFTSKGVNVDGSRNYGNFKVFIGRDVYDLDDEWADNHNLCRGIGAKLGKNHPTNLQHQLKGVTTRTAKVDGNSSYIGDINESGDAVKEITCR